MAPDGGGERGTLGTVRNASLLLKLLSNGAAYQQLTDLAERSGLSLPTVHRLLRSLVVAGLVEQNPESSRYSLGPELVRLSEQYLARLPVLRALGPYLVELRNTTKATVLVGLLVRGSLVYVDRLDGEDLGGVFRVSHRVHHPVDTAAGRVLLAHAGRAGRAVADGLADEDCLRKWAEAPHVLVTDELHDSAEVAVPVRDQGGRVLAALAAAGTLHSFPDSELTQRVVPQLLRVARATGSALSDA